MDECNAKHKVCKDLRFVEEVNDMCWEKHDFFFTFGIKSKGG